MSKHFFSGFAHQILIAFFIFLGNIPNACAQQTENKTQIVNSNSEAAVVNLVREAAIPLKGTENDYDALMNLIGDARFVMLGESTHGTHEYYRERARITRRLIEEKGFDAVVLEADWTDTERVNRFIHAEGKDTNAEKALSDFKRFPRWMWRNTDFRDFVNTLHSYNRARPVNSSRASIHGMDLYGLFDSSNAVINYLKTVNPEATRRARKRYGCLARFSTEPQRYGLEVSTQTTRSCERDVRLQYEELQQMLAKHKRTEASRRADDALFNAYQNARVVKNAEAYYRTVYQENVSSWNVRDQHMAETLDALKSHLDSYSGEKAKIVVWAHNTHQGDARATYMSEQGEFNVGQLTRQRYGKDAVLVGFTTYTGHVRAASEWGGFDERMRVRPGLEESYSGIFHKTGIPNFLLLLRDQGRVTEELGKRRLERAIGVIYLPRTERASHYFYAQLSRQFDAVIHFDTTNAVERLH